MLCFVMGGFMCQPNQVIVMLHEQHWSILVVRGFCCNECQNTSCKEHEPMESEPDSMSRKNCAVSSMC